MVVIGAIFMTICHFENVCFVGFVMHGYIQLYLGTPKALGTVITYPTNVRLLVKIRIKLGFCKKNDIIWRNESGTYFPAVLAAEKNSSHTNKCNSKTY